MVTSEAKPPNIEIPPDGRMHRSQDTPFPEEAINKMMGLRKNNSDRASALTVVLQREERNSVKQTDASRHAKPAAVTMS